MAKSDNTGSDSSNSDSDADTDSLAWHITSSWSKSDFHDGSTEKYLPENYLQRWSTKEYVKRELNNGITDDKLDSLVTFITEKADKVFAITCLIFEGEKKKITKAMRRFQEHQFDNESLPANLKDEPNKPHRVAVNPKAFTKSVWTQARSEDFDEKQWRFLAPVFRGAIFKYELDEDCILPFKKKDDRNDERTNVAVKELTTTRSAQEDAATAFRLEATALSKCRHIKHPNMLPCLAAIKKGPTYYFLFPWANGGSLREFWKRTSKPALTSKFVKDIIEQLHGLAAALEELHNYADEHGSPSMDEDAKTRYQGSGGIRHGDLKPENILLFGSGDSSSTHGFGTLKIADMGLAKHHDVNTRLRKGLTSTKYGTRRYEPPEVEAPRLKDSPTSRLYDTWSMGCIILEFIVWALYGQEVLDSFNDSIRGNKKHDSEPPYYQTGEGGAKVHPLVSECMERLFKNPRCLEEKTALGDLLAIVRDKLLVVDLPGEEDVSTAEGITIVHPPSPTGEEDTRRYRATAMDLKESLGNIKEKAAKDRLYSFTEEGKSGLVLLCALLIISQSLNIKVWEFENDDKFAVSSLIPAGPANVHESKFCQRCKDLDFRQSQFKIHDQVAQLGRSATDCQFCQLKWEACKHLDGQSSRVVFERIGPVIKMNESDPPVFSLFKSKESATLREIPIGRPFLQQSPLSDSQFQLMKRWLEYCDDNHESCKPDQSEHGAPSIHIEDSGLSDIDSVVSQSLRSRKSTRLPTRLLDLETGSVDTIRLYETQLGDRHEDFKYIALSHPWGEPTKSHPHFCTTVENRVAHLASIQLQDLPNTFKDAVITTRAIGLRYLWIDSLCIVQGPGGDFNTESQRMEDVFSSAYCVIAASRATGQWDGFLKDRPESFNNSYVTFKLDKGAQFYVSRYLDDFTQDVLEGSLNQRGWVLQERALARRTIYFTERQTYWECGGGVRCETLTKMNNQLAAFLGDPNFPQVAIRSSTSQRETSRGQRILYYQDLYKTYSRLKFTHWEDRAVAMNGLEQRLSWGFKCRGGFGILDDSRQEHHRSLLHRSLLWHRAKGSLEKIVFPPDRQKAPTWSWMAFQGEIDYLAVPFNGVDWDTGLKSPWQKAEAQSAGRSEVLEIRATARQLKLGNTPIEGLQLFFNSSGQSQPLVSKALCVIIGKEKGYAHVGDRTHYILLVRPTGSAKEGQAMACERIGAGQVPGRCIELDRPGSEVRIR
ncbi:hypothetical protein CEP53_004786 [Fusarium sp. AF-6]|nr:hypothetical protein CEP53_004786 [Fusarium sp. AF-6]